MATKSFLKDIVLRDKKSAEAFVSALENAERKGRKKVKIHTSVKTIENKDTIKKMFGAQ